MLVRCMIALVQLTKFVGFLVAVSLLAHGQAGWLDLGLLTGMYLLSMLGITAGFHRLFSHRSFQAHPALRFILAVLGTMAWQGSVLVWPAIHRRHHRYSDQPLDPHSPHTHAEVGFFGTLKGLWHAQTAWLFSFPFKLDDSYVPDLMRDPMLLGIHRWTAAWVAAGLILPGLLTTLLTHSFWEGFLWGGLARVFLVEQSTCMVNSLGHFFGSRPHATRDRSTNLGIFALLSLGDGWHNNHHAFPASARHGLTPWQWDPTYWLIRAWQALGLASNVVLPHAPYRPET